jgi:hypothetical protein
VAKHQYRSARGVAEDRNRFQAPHSRSASVIQFQSSASAQPTSPYICAFNRSAPLVPDQPPAGVKMGELSKMDSNSLIAAALAPPAPPVPSTLFKNYRKQVNDSYGSEPVPRGRDKMQQVSPNFIFSSLQGSRTSSNYVHRATPQADWAKDADSHQALGHEPSATKTSCLSRSVDVRKKRKKSCSVRDRQHV